MAYEEAFGSPQLRMSVLYILIPIAVLVVGAALAAFRWALVDGQFDDLSTPPLRVLTDEHDKDIDR